MGDLGQSLPPDTGAKLANLELGAEQAVASLGEAEQEHKRARTVRYDFQVTVFQSHKYFGSILQIEMGILDRARRKPSVGTISEHQIGRLCSKWKCTMQE